MMNIHGLTGMISFLDFLEQKKISYTIRYVGSDSLLVTFDVITKRVEVDFFEDHVEYSIFSGTEDVEVDVQALFDLIKEYTE